MKCYRTILLLATLLATPATAIAETYVDRGGERNVSFSGELPPYLQCVPYAREVSGIQIYGDAHTWWDQAEARYKRGHTPKVGAVLAFQPHRNMQLGHVAAVSKVIDSRTVLLRHANWSPINGRRGQIENDVKAVDVSPANDWSEVRVWYDPIKALGKAAWPTHGFIYSDKAPKFDRVATPRVQIAAARPAAPQPAPAPSVSTVPARTQSSPEFRNAFADLLAKPAPPAAAPVARAPVKPVRVAQTAPSLQRRTTDPLAAAVSRYD